MPTNDGDCGELCKQIDVKIKIQYDSIMFHWIRFVDCGPQLYKDTILILYKIYRMDPHHIDSRGDLTCNFTLQKYPNKFGLWSLKAVNRIRDCKNEIQKVVF